MNRYSILQNKKVCYFCGNQSVHIHEVYFGKNRKKSIEDGCCVYLCSNHHNLGNQSVHLNHDVDLFLKRTMERRWLEHYGKTIDDFIKRFGKNYL